MYQRVGVVIINKKNEVLLMHRIKNGKKYYSFLGGHPEKGETPEKTAIREITEETTLNVILKKELCQLEEPDGRGKGIYFLSTQFTGTAQLSGPEKKISCSTNQFTLEWVAIKDCKNKTIYPEKIALLIVNETNYQ